MPVVIGEVEVVPQDTRGAGQDAPAAAQAGDEPGPDDIALQRALQALQEQALRTWSH